MIFEVEDQNQRLKWAFASCKNGAWGDEPDGASDAICIRAADFDGQLGRLNNGERTLRSLNQKTFDKIALRDGDIIIEKSGGGEKQLVGRAVIFHGDEPSFTSNFLARCRPAEGIEPDYLNYLLLAIYNGRGTYPHLKQSTGIQNLDLGSFLDIKVDVPPLETQRRIAQFLDEKTARIDGLIEKKRALLERLAEKRQALITRAVTKGLNSDAPMKPSGIGWLGDIPEHWEVKRMKFVGRTRYGLGEPPAKDDEGIPFIRATDIYRGVVNLSQVQRVDRNAVPWNRKPELQAEEILIVRSGAYTGDSALVTKELAGFIAGYDMVFTAIHASPEFIAFVLLSKYMLEGQIHLARQRAAQPHLNAEELGGFIAALPSLAEQCEISRHLSKEISQQRHAEAQIEQSIGRLFEYRSALITAAVTGQLELA